jgi:hypothetical protein
MRRDFSRASLNLIDDQPLVIVNDRRGFSAQLGSVDLVPSGRRKTSAASLMLFGQRRHGAVVRAVNSLIFGGVLLA